MCVLVYLVTVLHSMQSGYMEKAQKYTEKALMQIDKLRGESSFCATLWTLHHLQIPSPLPSCGKSFDAEHISTYSP